MKYNKNEVTGKMRDRIILQNVNRSRSLTGFASESWADTATIWAFAESKLPGSNETIIDGKNTAKNVCDFTIRYISTITEQSRVVWGDKLYQVKNIKVSHDRRFISFQGVFYDSYILTGVNVAASVTGIATTSANLKLIMSVIGQANAIASAIGEIVTAQQGLVEVASSVVANGTSTADVTKVVFIDSSIAASANVSAEATIVQFVESSVQAAATSTADVQLTKVLESSVTADATATSAIDVIQQGLVTFEASVTATGTSTADVLRIATLESISSTTADTSAIATLTRVLEASATATAQTSSDAQITIPVNADATATANTTADAQLSYTVNASADATAQTSADAFITRIISADATATANSSAEAGIGVTFVAAAVATATSTNADLFRTATMVASVTGQATTSAALTLADNVAASVSGAATISATLTNQNDAAAFFARVTTAGGSLTTTEQNAITTLIINLKSYGIWDKMLAIYPMVGGGQANPAAACAQNLKSSSFTASFTGMTFASTGVKGNGTTSYMETNFNLTQISLARNFVFGGYQRIQQLREEILFGNSVVLADPRIELYARQGTGGYFLNIGGGFINDTNPDARGFYLGKSNAAGTHAEAYKNGTLFKTGLSTPALKSATMWLGAINGYSAYSSNEFAFAFLGDGQLTATDVSNFYTAVQAFQTTLGRQIEIVSDSDAQAFINRVYADGGTVTNQEANAVNQLVINLKANGIWTKMKAIYPMVGASAAACKQNLKSSSFTGTFSSGWTFASTGVTPNGTNAFMDTNLKSNLELSLNSAHLSIYSRTNIDGLYCDIGASITDASDTSIFSKYLNILYPRIHNINNGTANSSNSQGLFISNRITLSEIRAFQNNILKTIANNSNLQPSNNFTLANLNGGNFFSPRQYAFASIGDGLTDAEASNFYTAVQAFQQTLNRNV